MTTTRRIGEITLHIGSGATPRGGQAVYQRTGIPFIRSQNVRDGRLDLSGVAYISTEVHADMRRSAVQQLDVLLNITGASIGRSCVVPADVYLANVSQHVCILRSNEQVVPGYLHAMLEVPKTQHRIRQTAAGGSREGLNFQQVAALPIPWMPLDQQHAFVTLLDKIATATRRMNELLSAKGALKRGLLEELLTGRRRLHGFSGRLRRGRLGDHTSQVSRRNSSGWGAERVMGVIKGVGLEPMRDHVRASDLSRYKVVPPNGFAYNPMRLNIGSIARSHLAYDCLVSPDYVVFQANSETLLPAYLDQIRRSHIWGRFVRPAGAGSVRVRIYFRDLADLQIPLPSLDEQRSVVRVLEGLDREITLLEQLGEGYEQQKRALTRSFLSGELTVSSDVLEPEPAHA